MVNVRQPRDVAQILLSVLFLAIMIVACLWIVQPFILGFAWAGQVAITTVPAHAKPTAGFLPSSRQLPAV